MRRIPISFALLITYLLACVASTGLIVCVHDDGVAQIEWIASTCCTEMTANPTGNDPSSFHSAQKESCGNCKCQDHPLVSIQSQIKIIEPESKKYVDSVHFVAVHFLLATIQTTSDYERRSAPIAVRLSNICLSAIDTIVIRC